MKSLKILVALVVHLMFGAFAHSDPIAVSTKVGKFILPLQVVNATQLYSFKEGKGFPAVETVLWARRTFELTGGAAAILGTDTNVPFMGIQTRLSEKFFDTAGNSLRFGFWIGLPSRAIGDADKPKPVWGIKSSIALW